MHNWLLNLSRLSLSRRVNRLILVQDSCDALAVCVGWTWARGHVALGWFFFFVRPAVCVIDSCGPGPSSLVSVEVFPTFFGSIIELKSVMDGTYIGGRILLSACLLFHVCMCHVRV